MKIIASEIVGLKLKLKEPYTIAYETIDTAPNIYLKVETDKGLTGFGCAAPDYGVTGETLESTIDVYYRIIEPYLKGIDPFRYYFHISKLKEELMKYPSALAMVDMMFYDLVAKKADLPLYKMLGGFRSRILTSITIGVCPVKETISKSREFLNKGFKAIKIKGGISVDEDIERVTALRKELGSKFEIRFDANQGYSVEESIKFVENTRKSKIELIEQPTNKSEPDLMGRIVESVSIPVMADESLMNLRDAFKLAKKNLADMVNIKIMKVGGINESLHINSVAKSAGVEVMVGCMDESELGIAAGLHFALARPNVIYADLDSHFDLINDPAIGTVIFKHGYLYPNELPGLGAKLNLFN